jgi:hypothetical protein
LIALRQIPTRPAPRRQDRDQARVVTRCSFVPLVALHCRMSGHEPDARDLDQGRKVEGQRIALKENL